MTDDQLIVTQEGMDKLQNELKQRLARRKEIADKIEYAKNLGDLSENFEYQEAKEDQSENENRVLELQDMIRRSVVKEKASEVNEGISLGSQIKVQSNGQERDFEIVSFNEAEPLEGKISNESPLGKAFLGKKEGDSVEVDIPKGKVTYKILEIK